MNPTTKFYGLANIDVNYSENNIFMTLNVQTLSGRNCQKWQRRVITTHQIIIKCYTEQCIAPVKTKRELERWEVKNRCLGHWFIPGSSGFRI